MHWIYNPYDFYFNKAKQEWYKARSAFKLEEIQEPEEKEVAAEPKKRGRKKKSVSEELEEERKAVEKENAEIIANSNLPEGKDEVPFEEIVDGFKRCGFDKNNLRKRLCEQNSFFNSYKRNKL